MSGELQSIQRSKDISAVIAFLRFPLTVIIVMYHCYCVQTPDRQPLYDAVSYPLGLMIGETGVPAFFFISGFLFFFSQRKYSQKLQTRVRTLLVPYVVWNAVVLLGYLALMAVGYAPEIADKSLANFQFTDYVRAFFDRGHWDRGNGQPLLCPYWYVRNLILLSVVAPFIGIMVKGRKGLLLLFVLLIWWMTLPYNGMIAQSLLFFSMGAFFSVNKLSPLTLANGGGKKVVMTVGLVVAALDWLSHVCFPVYGSLYIHRLGLILNIFVLFLVGSYLSKRFEMPSLLSKASFWIYTTHYPLTLVIRSWHLELGDWGQTAFYGVSALVVTLLCIASFWIGEKSSPKTISILTGNR